MLKRVDFARKDRKEPTFELKLVLAALNKLSLSLKSTGVDISSKYSTTFFAALPKASAMMVG